MPCLLPRLVSACLPYVSWSFSPVFSLPLISCAYLQLSCFLVWCKVYTQFLCVSVYSLPDTCRFWPRRCSLFRVSLPSLWHPVCRAPVPVLRLLFNLDRLQWFIYLFIHSSFLHLSPFTLHDIIMHHSGQSSSFRAEVPLHGGGRISRSAVFRTVCRVFHCEQQLSIKTNPEYITNWAGKYLISNVYSTWSAQVH